MTNFSAYFDDSGHPNDQPYVVVAGFIATEDQWRLFERDWRGILDPLGIDVFHMVDFEASRRWKPERKAETLRKLIATIKLRTRFQISQIVSMEAYRKVNEKYALEEVIGTPYALAGRTVAKSTNDWKRKYGKDEDKIAVFFEDGTKHKGDFMDAMTRDKLPCPTFLKKSDALQLQASDLAAWECFKTLKSWGKALQILRPSFKELNLRHPTDSGIYLEHNLETMCQMLPEPIPLRVNLAPGAQIVHATVPNKIRRRTIRGKGDLK